MFVAQQSRPFVRSLMHCLHREDALALSLPQLLALYADIIAGKATELINSYRAQPRSSLARKLCAVATDSRERSFSQKLPQLGEREAKPRANPSADFPP